MGDEACGGGECVCVCERRRLRARVEGGRRRLRRGPPKSYAVLVFKKKYFNVGACESLPTAAHRCSRGASGRNKEFRVACFSHSTTMRETTVCYLRPKRGPTGKAAGRALRESVDSGPLLQETMVRERAFATILARGWLAAQASVMPPALPRPGLPRCHRRRSQREPVEPEWSATCFERSFA